jgi:hypothetical protein
MPYRITSFAPRAAFHALPPEEAPDQDSMCSWVRALVAAGYLPDVTAPDGNRISTSELEKLCGVQIGPTTREPL